MAQVICILGIQYRVTHVLVLGGVAKFAIHLRRDEWRGAVGVFGNGTGRDILGGLTGIGGCSTDLEERSGGKLIIQPNGIAAVIIENDNAVIFQIASAQREFVFLTGAGDGYIVILVKSVAQDLVIPIGIVAGICNWQECRQLFVIDILCGIGHGNDVGRLRHP